MTALNRIAGATIAVAALTGMTWLSRVPISSGHSGASLLRLTWRARPERIETCVAQSPATLAALPPHMRQALLCDGVSATYRLEVRQDGNVVAEQVVAAGGLRRDRPLYVFREIPLPEGDATITVRFTRVEARREHDDEDQRRDELTEAVPASLTWEQRVSFAQGQVRVISYDPERRMLFEVRQD